MIGILLWHNCHAKTETYGQNLAPMKNQPKAKHTKISKKYGIYMNFAKNSVLWAAWQSHLSRMHSLSFERCAAIHNSEKSTCIQIHDIIIGTRNTNNRLVWLYAMYVIDTGQTVLHCMVCVRAYRSWLIQRQPISCNSVGVVNENFVVVHS